MTSKWSRSLFFRADAAIVSNVSVKRRKCVNNVFCFLFRAAAVYVSNVNMLPDGNKSDT